MNLPNKLTVGRLVMTGVFVVGMSVEFAARYSVGLVLFSLAMTTDYLDGKIARDRGLVTSFGKLMDPLADKVLMGAGFVLLVGLGLIPAWAVVVILSREFLVTGMRLVASAKGAVLAADRLGKLKTVLQTVCVIYYLCVLASAEVPFAFLQPLLAWAPLSPPWFGNLSLAAAVAVTVLSGISYFKNNLALFADA